MKEASITKTPEQRIGRQTGVTEKVRLRDRNEAQELFYLAKHRLLDINNWHRLCGKGSAVFELRDGNGRLSKASAPRIGDYISIDLPAPGNKAGNGFDWVRIEAMESKEYPAEDKEVFSMRVRPAAHPIEQQSTAHFYTEAATSNFIVARKGRIVMAMEKGRNELPNTGPTSLLNRMRNLIIAVSAMIGLAKPQWRSLMKGVIKK